MAASVGRLRKASMTRRRKQADRTGARRSSLFHRLGATSVKQPDFVTRVHYRRILPLDHWHPILNCMYGATRPNDKHSRVDNSVLVPPFQVLAMVKTDA